MADHVGVINYKDYAMQEHSAVLDVERGQLARDSTALLADRHFGEQ